MSHSLPVRVKVAIGENSPVKVVMMYFVWFLIGISFLIAFPLLLGAAMVPKESLWHDIVRDIGIAFLVAPIVAGIYELHVRSKFDIETMTGVLNTTLGEIIRPEIWKEVKHHVIEREMIREDVDIHLEVVPLGSLPGPAALWMQFEYDLYGLHSRTTSIDLTHYLDDHIKFSDLPNCDQIDPQFKDLPRFEYIKVGDQVLLDLKDGRQVDCVKDGRFTIRIPLNPKDGPPTRVITRRTEITYIPGSYNLIMGELTKGLSLHLVQLPDGIEAAVNIRPHRDYPVPFVRHHVLGRDDFQNMILLPGQGLEFRFKPKSITIPAEASLSG